ncbi:tetratricopeptide repeat protein [Rugamonas apoptosis]|uniref:Tetratricopeptide repeat protein n=1 Tax=Rugamonas apoptosis TaxID=2758570 RepID=A0A7W2FA64_9BURK|nr:tetratricopeptide repeat protein [Rugamonas apoptosis]MBA5687988.1 tetratricopeptide repeat protein [Rugamonas apoptosis]
MRRRLLTSVLATVLATALAGPARADEAPPFPPVQQEELYVSAMKALADGHPDDATRLLMRFLEKEPQHAGAWLDLAISQCELGHGAEAERLFVEIERRFAPPPGIVEVIQGHRTRGCHPLPAGRRDLLSLSAGRGYDNNVNQGASNAFFSTGSGANYLQWQLTPDYLPKADGYSLLTADYSGNLGQSKLLGFAQLRVRRHDHEHEQDMASALAGLEQPWQWGQWRGRATAGLSALELNGHYYQRQAQVQLRATPPVDLPEALEWSLTSGLSHVTYPTRTKYDANTVELSSTLNYRDNVRQALAGVGVLSDHGQAGRLGGNRDGWYGNLLLYSNLGERFSGQLGWTRQVWRGSTVYSPNVIDLVRRQDTRLLTASISMQLPAHHSLQLEWRSTQNRENISLFQYNSRSLQLTWHWDGF